MPVIEHSWRAELAAVASVESAGQNGVPPLASLRDQKPPFAPVIRLRRAPGVVGKKNGSVIPSGPSRPPEVGPPLLLPLRQLAEGGGGGGGETHTRV